MARLLNAKMRQYDGMWECDSNRNRIDEIALTARQVCLKVCTFI